MRGWCIHRFQLLMLAIYPTFIAPISNKFSPLDAGDTRSAIEALLKRADFTSNGLFVMDGSKRSAHGNAYFTGFGRAKRIVFFDALLERLSTDARLFAVLAHELGHFKRKHIVKRIVFIALASLAQSWRRWPAAAQPWLYSSFGFPTDTGAASPGVALLLFSLALPCHCSSGLHRSHLPIHANRIQPTVTRLVASRDDLIAALTKLPPEQRIYTDAGP